MTTHGDGAQSADARSSTPVLGRMKKAELVDEVVRLQGVAQALAAVVNKELTFRDLEAKMRDGTLDVSMVLGEGAQPVTKFLAALMLHWLLGEGHDDPHEPENYLSGEFILTPAGEVRPITCAMEIIKPGGKSSHKFRAELEAENVLLRQQISVLQDEHSDETKS